MSTTQQLKRVRDIIASGRWRQGEIGVRGGEVCLVGAISEVEQRSTYDGKLLYPGDDDPLVQALYEVLPKSFKKYKPETAVTTYNDRRSHGRVVSLIDRAIANSTKETT